MYCFYSVPSDLVHLRYVCGFFARIFYLFSLMGVDRDIGIEKIMKRRHTYTKTKYNVVQKCYCHWLRHIKFDMYVANQIGIFVLHCVMAMLDFLSQMFYTLSVNVCSGITAVICAFSFRRFFSFFHFHRLVVAFLFSNIKLFWEFIYSHTKCLFNWTKQFFSFRFWCSRVLLFAQKQIFAAIEKSCK